MTTTLFKISLAALVLAACFFITSCSREDSSFTPRKVAKLEDRIGKDTVFYLQSSSNILTLQIKPDGKNGFSTVEEAALTNDVSNRLKEVLLEDDSYIFDRTKSCLFLPTEGWRFKGKEDVVVLYSSYCKQIKITTPRKNFILDIDPVNEDFKALSNKN